MRRTPVWTGIIFSYLFFQMACGQPASGQDWAVARLHLPAGAVRLRLLYEPRHGLTRAAIRAVDPRALAVLTGGFYAEGHGLSPAGLIIWRGRCEQAPSRRADRSAIGLTRQGRLVISTARKMFRDRARYQSAVEAGPFLWSGGRRWSDFRGLSASFCRASAPRMAVGLTKAGRLFWATGWGTPSGFQAALAARFHQLAPREQIAVAILLDGGMSCLPWRALPTRVVIDRVATPQLARH